MQFGELSLNTKEMKKNALPIVSFSFDDGRQDNFLVAKPILEKYGLAATFNITTGYVNGTIPKGVPCLNPPLSIGQLQELALNPLFEIAAHGHFHLNAYEDIKQGVGLLRHWVGVNEEESIGFASPGSGLDINLCNSLKNIGIKYARISCRHKSFPIAQRVARRMCRIIKSPMLFTFAYKDTVINPSLQPDPFLLHSIPILKEITVKQIVSLVNYAIKRKSSVILMMHSVLTDGDFGYEDSWSWDASKFDELCRQLSIMQAYGMIKVGKTEDIVESLH